MFPQAYTSPAGNTPVVWWQGSISKPSRNSRELVHSMSLSIAETFWCVAARAYNLKVYIHVKIWHDCTSFDQVFGVCCKVTLCGPSHHRYTPSVDGLEWYKPIQIRWSIWAFSHCIRNKYIHEMLLFVSSTYLCSAWLIRYHNEVCCHFTCSRAAMVFWSGTSTVCFRTTDCYASMCSEYNRQDIRMD